MTGKASFHWPGCLGRELGCLCVFGLVPPAFFTSSASGGPSEPVDLLQEAPKAQAFPSSPGSLPSPLAFQSWAQNPLLPSPNEVTLFRHEALLGAAQLVMARGFLTGTASPSVSQPAGAPVEQGELGRGWGSLPAGLVLPSQEGLRGLLCGP